MSETYQSKRERWHRLLETLPAGLREHVALRNVEAVASLPPQAQARLMEAIRAGLKSLPSAVEKLKINPNLPVAELLDPAVVPPVPESTTQIQDEISDMIQQCFPDMPRISADALAEAGLMSVARSIGLAHRTMLVCDHLKTDFVMMVVYGLIRQTLEQLEERIDQTPSVRQALEQSALPWKPNTWRKQNA